MDARRLYRPGRLPPSIAHLQIQEADVALLPLRPLLLRHHPQLCLHLDSSSEPGALRGVLLFITWVGRERCDYMAE